VSSKYSDVTTWLEPLTAEEAQELERLRLIERTARRLCVALGEDDRPRGEAIDEMRRVLGMEGR
jgi:hypothetical protein